MGIGIIDSVVVHTVAAIDLLNNIHSVSIAGRAMAYGTTETAGIHELKDGITEETYVVRSIHLNAEQTVKPVTSEPEEYEILVTLHIILVLNAQLENIQIEAQAFVLNAQLVLILIKGHLNVQNAQQELTHQVVHHHVSNVQLDIIHRKLDLHLVDNVLQENIHQKVLKIV